MLMINKEPIEEIELMVLFVNKWVTIMVHYRLYKVLQKKKKSKMIMKANIKMKR